MTAAIIIIIGAAAFGLICGRLMARNPLVRIHSGKVVQAILVVIALGGISMISLESRRIEYAAGRRSWPVADGAITVSEVRGQRAYHPFLGYTFTVDGTSYSGESTLQTPGFGPKSSRQEVARKSLAGFPVGGTVKVHYNPTAPTENCLKTGASWDSFMRLSMGFILTMSAVATAMLLRHGSVPAANTTASTAPSNAPPTTGE